MYSLDILTHTKSMSQQTSNLIYFLQTKALKVSHWSSFHNPAEGQPICVHSSVLLPSSGCPCDQLVKKEAEPSLQRNCPSVSRSLKPIQTYRVNQNIASFENWVYWDCMVRSFYNIIHSKTPHIVTVLWLDSDGVVTVHLSISGTTGRLQNRVSVPPWFLFSDYVYRVPTIIEKGVGTI